MGKKNRRLFQLLLKTYSCGCLLHNANAFFRVKSFVLDHLPPMHLICNCRQRKLTAANADEMNMLQRTLHCTAKPKVFTSNLLYSQCCPHTITTNVALLYTMFGLAQRWTIGSNLEPDRSRPLELWRLRSAPGTLEMELFGSDRLLETLRWSFGSGWLQLNWSCFIFL